MAAKTIDKYQLAWQYSSNRGAIVLLFSGGGAKQINGLAFQDYQAMVDILRNEKPVWYDEGQSLLATAHELVGEGEHA